MTQVAIFLQNSDTSTRSTFFLQNDDTSRDFFYKIITQVAIFFMWEKSWAELNSQPVNASKQTAAQL